MATHADLAYAVTVSKEIESLSSALERLRSGEITIERYLQIQVEVMLAPQRGTTPLHELDMLRDVLLDDLRSGPFLIDLLRQLGRGASDLPVYYRRTGSSKGDPPMKH